MFTKDKDISSPAEMVKKYPPKYIKNCWEFLNRGEIWENSSGY